MTNLIIKPSGIAGMGVFSQDAIAAGEIITQMTGKRITGAEADGMDDVPVDNFFQVAEDEYLLLDEVPMTMNHSCNPNAGVRGENTLVALCDITAGEELTYDYSSQVGTNNDGWEMPCRCGAATCRKVIGSVLTLPKEQLDYYRAQNALPDFIVSELDV